VYYFNGAQWYEQFLQVGWLYRALILLGLALLSPERLCVFGLNCAILIFFCLHPSLYLVSWAWWDWPLTWLTNHRPSVLWHCWLGHVTRKIVSEMTYNVSSGTLNSTIPLPYRPSFSLSDDGTMSERLNVPSNFLHQTLWQFDADPPPTTGTSNAHTHTHIYLPISNYGNGGMNKKLSCRREAAWCFVSSTISQVHSRSLKIIRNGTFEYNVSQLVFHSVSATVSEIFSQFQRQIVAWPWNLGYGSFKVFEKIWRWISWPRNSGYRSLKVIKNGTFRKLFTFDSNYGSISYLFRDKARYWPKFVIFFIRPF